MKVSILEKKTDLEQKAEIKKILKKELPLKKDGWNFNWRELSKVEGSFIYKITLLESPNKIEGILMLTMFNEEMLFMNNIELAPHNIGKNKKYDSVAGCLLAYGCRESFEKGKGNYHGFLSFDSKTELIELYQNKYGASLAIGHKMFFAPESGKKLMKQYLGIKK